MTQLTHATVTVIVLAALLFGAARVGALNGVLAPVAAPAQGSSFTTINYQGRLADSVGTPLNGTYGMSFFPSVASVVGTIGFSARRPCFLPILTHVA